MSNLIKGIIISGVSGTTTAEFFPDSAVTSTSAVTTNGLWTNASGNLELLSEGTNTKGDPTKININAAGDIQVKTGFESVLQLDAENSTGSTAASEYAIKICNGYFGKANRVISTKFNTAELVFDTQNAHTTAGGFGEDTFAADEFNMKFRLDKWNGGVDGGTMGPIYAKLKARAFDFRCYDHGGIALQVAGQDSDNHENKIKFESDRTSPVTSAATYSGEGGKGLEFGTFNNLHTSLFTGDYRFNGEANVYGVTREIAETEGKIDYVTQSDDTKDILDITNYASWNDIIKVAKDYKNGKISGGSGSTSGSVSLDGYFTSAETMQAIDLKVSPVSGNVVSLMDAAGVKYVSLSDKKNVEVDASSILTYYSYVSGGCYNIVTDESGVTTYTYVSGGSEEFSASTETLDITIYNESGESFTVNTAGTATYASKVNLVSNRKVSIKGAEGTEIEGASLAFPIEISKKNKLTCGDYEVTGLTTLDEFIAACPKIELSIEKNNSTISEVAALGTGKLSISLYNLIKLQERVTALEADVKALKGE